MPLWDRMKSELDRAGRAAQVALDEGKLRLEMHRARQAADAAAQRFGYAMFRALKEGRDLPGTEIAEHVDRIGAAERDAERLEQQLRDLKEKPPAAAG